MKIFSYGLDQMTVGALKNEGYSIVVQNRFPEPDQVADQILILTSDVLPVEQLTSIREKYSDAILLYHFLKKGIRSLRQIHLICESLNIHFLSSMATAKTFIDKLRLILNEDINDDYPIIGFFGSGPGVGCTSIAATIAKKLHANGQRVIMLGLNLFDPGWDHATKVSLDQWRPRITGKIIQPEDFKQLIDKEGFSYLPGNYDYLGTFDYQEVEIEYLLETAKSHADIIVADFGAIPQSAAWYVGMQWSTIRYFVTKPTHLSRMKELLSLASHLDLEPIDFNLVLNQVSENDLIGSKSFQQTLGMTQMIELPYGTVDSMQLSIQFGKKEQQIIDQHVQTLLTIFGLHQDVERKRRLFG